MSIQPESQKPKIPDWLQKEFDKAKQGKPTSEYEVYITIQGWGHLYPKNVRVVEVYDGESILAEVLALPRSFKLYCQKPEGIRDDLWNNFRMGVQQAINARNTTMNTISVIHERWAMNAVCNVWQSDRIPNSTPIQKLPNLGDTAIIFGNGPSVRPHPLIYDAIPFVCWHAVPKVLKMHILPLHVGHIDIESPHYDWEGPPAISPGCKLIVTPTVDPNFLKLYPKNDIYTILSTECYLHATFANLMKAPDSSQIVGTVTHALAQAAVYGGYKRILLMGVDLCTEDPNDPFLGGLVKESKNVRGETVYTNDTLMLYHSGFQNLVTQNPDVTWINLTNKGLPIPGFLHMAEDPQVIQHRPLI